MSDGQSRRWANDVEAYKTMPIGIEPESTLHLIAVQRHCNPLAASSLEWQPFDGVTAKTGNRTRGLVRGSASAQLNMERDKESTPISSRAPQKTSPSMTRRWVTRRWVTRHPGSLRGFEDGRDTASRSVIDRLPAVPERVDQLLESALPSWART